jgi:hypothetical protein
MRIILLALIALACAMPPAEAARRDEQRTAASRTAQHAQPRAATRTAPARQTPRATAQRAAVQRGDVRTQGSGVLVRGAAAATISREAVARCTLHNGRRSCAPPRNPVAGWQAGLPTVSYQQRECPAGTFATLARGHDDVIRCMPM